MREITRQNVGVLKKRIVSLILVVFMLIPAFVTPINAKAPKIGDEIGNVLNTDIKTYIDGYRIPSYNISGKSAVLIKDLRNYGFEVVYNDEKRISTVNYNPDKKFTPLTEFNENTKKTGTVAFRYLYTDIVAYVNGKKVESFNIKGNLAIFFGDLKDYGTFIYNDTKRESRFTLNKIGAVTVKEDKVTQTNNTEKSNSNTENTNNNTANNNSNTGNSNNSGNSNSNQQPNQVAQNNTSGGNYTVKFNLNYSNPKGTIPDQSVKSGGYANRPTTEKVKRENYLLAEWYTDKDCKNKFSFDMPINKNITLYAKWDFYDDIANSYEDLVQIGDMFSEIAKKHYNNKGYVDYEDFNKVMEEVVICVQNLYEQGKILKYEYSEDVYSICITRKNGNIYSYTPYNPELLSGGGSGIQIKSYRPFNNQLPLGDNFTPLFWDFIPLPKIAEAYSIATQGTYTGAYCDSGVDIEILKKMSGDIIFWEGHGVWYGDEVGTGLATVVKKTDEEEFNYAEDGLVECGDKEKGYYYAITAKFISEHLPNNCFNGALIYLNTCSSLKNEVLSDAFINKGAKVVIGNTDTIDIIYARYLFGEVMTNLLTIKDNTNTFYTVKESIELASANIHASKLANTKKNGKDSTVTCHGYEDFTLLWLTGNIIDKSEIKEDGVIYQPITDKEAKVIGVYETRKSYSIRNTIQFAGKEYTVVEIADNTFGEAVYGAKITQLPENLERIGDWAFAYNDLSECKKFPESLLYIGKSAFYQAILPSEFTLTKYKYISEKAFFNVSNVKTLNIDKTFDYFIADIFSCRDLEKVTVHLDNKDYKSIDDMLYSKDGTTLYIYPAKKQLVNNDCIVPNDTEIIMRYAFYYAEMSKITLPPSVYLIMEHAFYNCVNLDSVVIKNPNVVINDYAIVKKLNQEIKIYSYDSKTNLVKDFVDNYNIINRNHTKKLVFVPLDNKAETTGIKGEAYFFDTSIDAPVISSKLEGVTVKLYDVNNLTEVIETATTDSDGAFIIYCPNGVYRVQFEKEGYLGLYVENVEVKDTIEDLHGMGLKKVDTIGAIGAIQTTDKTEKMSGNSLISSAENSGIVVSEPTEILHEREKNDTSKTADLIKFDTDIAV